MKTIETSGAEIQSALKLNGMSDVGCILPYLEEVALLPNAEKVPIRYIRGQEFLNTIENFNRLILRLRANGVVND